jgi:hypothetical protein
MAPRNVYLACPACPVAPEDGTGVESEGYSSGEGQNDRTRALCAMPCPPSHIAPFAFCAFASASSEALLKPGAPFFALCPLHHACRSTGVRSFFKQGPYKAPSTQREDGAFFLLTLGFNLWPCALSLDPFHYELFSRGNHGTIQ